MKVLQINTVLNSGSTGRIAEEIGKLLISSENESYIAYSRAGNESISRTIKVGNKIDFYHHILISRLFDNHGFASENSTGKLVSQIEKINPDIIHLHNVHGYYLNIEILFPFLKKLNKPIVWTFHDCWPFTGHCSHFQFVNCNKWQSECMKCPNIHAYPKSWFTDHSSVNFERKKHLFTGFSQLVIVSPSNWLAEQLQKSFLKEYAIRVIHNGVDLDVFKPMDKIQARQHFNLADKRILLGVASVWTDKKGLGDFVRLQSRLDKNTRIVLVGLTKRQITELPPEIMGINRTESVHKLAALYSAADIFINPTYVDNFPTTNIEALACGTPVITYDTGGSAEIIDENTGIKVTKGNLDNLLDSVSEVYNNPDKYTPDLCRRRAELYYSSSDRYNDYLKTYVTIMNSVN